MNALVKKATTSITRIGGRTLLKINKKSPEILMVTGIAGFIGTVVLASKATLKAQEVLDRRKSEMKIIEDAMDVDGSYAVSTDRQKDTLIVNIKTAGRFARLYAPSVALGAFSLACIVKGNGILRSRYLSAVSAFNAVSEAFKEYRERVISEEGVEADRHYRYGTTREKIDVVEMDDDGKSHKKKETIENLNVPGKPSIYARYFDQVRDDGLRNPNWFENPEHSMVFLRGQENIANDILQTRGHIFLNEVYEMLGLSHSQEGALVGWVKGNGDNCVDFGLYDLSKDSVRRFVNGKDNVILLDFNVDGVIYDKI